MCTLFLTLFFHIVSLSFDTKVPVLSRFFEPVSVELFRLFLKPFAIAAWTSASHVK
jgi:hypothetical protein